MSRSQFDNRYSASKQNLSSVSQPDCLKDAEFYEPPHFTTEAAHSKIVAKYLSLRHWEDKRIFRQIVRNIHKFIGDLSVTVSIVYQNSVFYQYESGFPYTETPRGVSLDAHAILSKGWFHLADASRDWRTWNNPFVTEQPCIRFYYGVRLLSSTGVPLGVLAVFSASPRNIPLDKLEILSKYANRLIEHLETPYDVLELERSKRLLNKYSKNDAELIELSGKLGRATSTGGQLTIFERDGSGSAYSGNRIFKLNSGLTSSRNRHFLPTSLVDKLFKTINSLADKSAVMGLLARSIVEQENLDYACIIDVKVIIEVSAAARRAEINQCLLKEKTSVLVDSKRLVIQMLGQSSSRYEMIKTHEELWHITSTSNWGVTMNAKNGNTMFTSGVIIPISGPDIKMSSTSESIPDGKKNLARCNTVLLAAFNKSGHAFSLSKISRLYDHAQVCFRAAAAR